MYGIVLGTFYHMTPIQSNKKNSMLSSSTDGKLVLFCLFDV
jgi:hypothetical protein